ncbi:hypothetical protein [Chelatococcus reniformis]|uniref:Uncharacterized protein n=1 Tax=Chelatococcus reniformis TaxID=1494448 RepID=A0A916USH6_9HYPH|nr:hypothetical protein [Chelatococcus reniformis]GGC86212.1 hypothetical protein GCM10010994_50140 [Chelatococcus reniformis]
MKLASKHVDQTLSQFEAQVIPDGHPLTQTLSDMFGEHTFFLSANGLNIIEPDGAGEAGDATGRVVRIASWSSERHDSLAPHQPEFTGIVVELDKAA